LVILQPINPEVDLASVNAEEEDQDVDAAVPVVSQAVDMLQ
jgi:hypothetical protein